MTLLHDCLNFRHMIKPPHAKNSMVPRGRGLNMGTALLEAPQVAHPELTRKRQWPAEEQQMIWGFLGILWWLTLRQKLILMRLIPGRAIGRYRF